MFLRIESENEQSARMSYCGESPVAPIVVLAIDDEPHAGRVLRAMFWSEPDVQVNVCEDPRRAIELARELLPSIILLDLSMPGIDGLSLLKCMRDDPMLGDVPIMVLSGKNDPLVMARVFSLGATDYLVKLPSRVELVARIRRHHRAHREQIESRNALNKLAETERRMTLDVSHAAQYVQSLLPRPIRDEHVRIDWRFEPSTQLGGDAFGYHWLDEQRLAIYLFDVCGHDIGASLLAVSVLNTLSQQLLPGCDFSDPAVVMRDLNRAFHADGSAQRFFTIWYGVYSTTTRTLTFCGGGHPSPLLFGGSTKKNARLSTLPTCGAPIGVAGELDFENKTIDVPAWGQLIVFSDGVFGFPHSPGTTSDLQEFADFVHLTGPGPNLMERILHRAQRLEGSTSLKDDCSLMEIEFY